MLELGVNVTVLRISAFFYENVLLATAERARVTLHLWDPKARGRLTGPILREAVPGWRESDVWFCGPVEFGNDVRRDLFRAGLPASAFHQELFHLR